MTCLLDFANILGFFERTARDRMSPRLAEHIESSQHGPRCRTCSEESALPHMLSEVRSAAHAQKSPFCRTCSEESALPHMLSGVRSSAHAQKTPLCPSDVESDIRSPGLITITSGSKASMHSTMAFTLQGCFSRDVQCVFKKYLSKVRKCIYCNLCFV